MTKQGSFQKMQNFIDSTILCWIQKVLIFCYSSCVCYTRQLYSHTQAYACTGAGQGVDCLYVRKEYGMQSGGLDACSSTLPFWYYTSVTVELVCFCGVTLREASNFDSKGHVYIAHFLDNLHTLGIYSKK